uniref:Cytochrome P450 n=1 Tax=Chelonoidis abingdonii TaxID=106734 RepID=A0A8C0JGK4_CHEAB
MDAQKLSPLPPSPSAQLQDTYGPVFTVNLGSRRVVVLCGYQAVKEALVDQAEEFSGRGDIPAFSKDFNGHGVVFANGERWRQLRRFSLTTLRNFGMGKRSIEERIQEEAQCLVEEFQKTQEKIHQEIDVVIGRDRAPTAEDRGRMPYTDATLHEIQRFSDILPMSLPHTVTRDTRFRGYLIPQGTYVYPLLSTVHFDPEEHKDPETFAPERFLNENGSFRKQNAFLPFSAGKRVCLGEGLARMELFLFFTTILQHFTLSSPVDPQQLSLAPEVSNLGKVPPRYQLCLRQR